MEKRFKVGDTLTYLSHLESAARVLSWRNRGAGYVLGGQDYGGAVGKLVKYTSFHSSANCWEIDVTLPGGLVYSMLESEFEEYYAAREITNYEIY